MVSGLLYILRIVMKRWIDGPDPVASSEPWPVVPPGPSAVPASARTPSPAPAPAAKSVPATKPANATPKPAPAAKPTLGAKAAPVSEPRPAVPAQERVTKTTGKLVSKSAPKEGKPEKPAGGPTRGAVRAAKSGKESPRKAPAKKAPAQAAQKPEPWVAPSEHGSVPATHPVKAKLASRIYHLPGMSFYDRTNPDRCYVSAEAAEADGFSRAKR